MTDFDAGATMSAVDTGAERLEKAASELYECTKRFETAENAYDRAVEIELVRIWDAHKSNGKGRRLPAEDIRKALAHHKIPEDVYRDYLVAKAEMAGQDKRYRALAAAVSARQSLLRVLGGMGG